MKGEEEEMKQREFLVNMCCAQLLSWCPLAMLRALGLNSAHHNPERVRVERKVCEDCGIGQKEAIRA